MSGPDFTAFRENVLALMMRQRIRQAELARRSGLGAGNLCRVLSGDRDPTMRQLARLARALHVPPAELLKGVTGVNEI